MIYCIFFTIKIWYWFYKPFPLNVPKWSVCFTFLHPFANHVQIFGRFCSLEFLYINRGIDLSKLSITKHICAHGHPSGRLLHVCESCICMSDRFIVLCENPCGCIHNVHVMLQMQLLWISSARIRCLINCKYILYSRKACSMCWLSVVKGLQWWAWSAPSVNWAHNLSVRCTLSDLSMSRGR